MKTSHLIRQLFVLACIGTASSAYAYTPTAATFAADVPGALIASSSTAIDSAGAAISDTTVTAKAKAELLSTKNLKSQDIHVTTQDGHVHLTGSVPDDQQRTQAVAAVRNLDGVKGVTDDLKVEAQ